MFVLLLAGCATSPVSSDAAKAVPTDRNGEQVKIYVEQDEHVAGASAQSSICGGGTDQTAITATTENLRSGE